MEHPDKQRHDGDANEMAEPPCGIFQMTAKTSSGRSLAVPQSSCTLAMKESWLIEERKGCMRIAEGNKSVSGKCVAGHAIEVLISTRQTGHF